MKYTLLEPLRGVAAIWVFAFHYHFTTAFQQTFPTLFLLSRHGDLGVPMFFVISGYCIAASAQSTVRRDEPVTAFLRRRLRRIYPPYWFSIIVVALVPFAIEGLSRLKTGQYVPPSPDLINYGYLRFGIGDWLRVATLAQVFAYVPEASDLQFKFTAINAVYWTLAIEVQFYLVAAAGVLARSWLKWWFVTVTILAIPASLGGWLYTSGLFLPYWPMFAAGIAIFLIFDRGFTPSQLLRGSARAVSGGIVISAVAVLCSWVAVGRPVTTFWFTLSFALVLFGAEGLEGSFGRALTNRSGYVRAIARLATILGMMSYSIYLIHGRLQFLADQIARQITGETVTRDVLVIGLTLVGCYVFHRFCERPFIVRPQSPRKLTPLRIEDAAAV